MKSKHVSNVLWVILLLISGIYFLTNTYEDFTVVIKMSYDLVDGIFSGKFLEGLNSVEWLYGISIYFVVAIWSLPVLIISKICGTELVLSIGGLLWYKILVVLIAGCCIYVTLKIAEKLFDNFEKNQKKDVVFTYVTSMAFILPVLELAQWDSFELLFMLLGVNYFLKNDEKKFIIFFAVANTMKPLTMFVFVPLLFYRYKEILKILVNSILGISIFLIEKVVLGLLSTSSSVGSGKVKKFLTVLFGHKSSIGMTVSIYLLLFIILCVVLYMINYEENNSRLTIWIIAVALTVFMTTGGIMPYWILLVTPFYALLIHFDSEKMNASIILESFGTLMFVIYQCATLTWVFGNWDSFDHLVMKNIGQHSIKWQNPVRYYFDIVKASPEIIDDNLHLITAMIIGCWCGLLILSCPLRKQVKNSRQIQAADNWIQACRLLIPIVFWILCFRVLVIL